MKTAYNKSSFDAKQSQQSYWSETGSIGGSTLETGCLEQLLSWYRQTLYSLLEVTLCHRKIIADMRKEKTLGFNYERDSHTHNRKIVVESDIYVTVSTVFYHEQMLELKARDKKSKMFASFVPI